MYLKSQTAWLADWTFLEDPRTTIAEQRNAFCTKLFEFNMSQLFCLLKLRNANYFILNPKPKMFNVPGRYRSNAPYYHHDPQFIRVGEYEETRIEKVEPKAEEEFSHDQIIKLDSLENAATLYETCKKITRTLKLPGLIQNLGHSSPGFKGPSNDEMRRLIDTHNARLAKAKTICRPMERGVCIGYWKPSKPPFRHAVYATQKFDWTIMLQIAETNEEGIYQAPVPLGINPPLLWTDVVLAKKFDFIDANVRNDAIKVAIRREAQPY